MFYCPKCKVEYEKSEKVCPNCGEKLIPKNNVAKSAKAYKKEKLLISVSEGFEAEMIQDSLKSAEIPFVRKGHGGPAGFSRYDTKYDSLGVDFYVPSNLLERAKALIPPVEDMQISEEDNRHSCAQESPQEGNQEIDDLPQDVGSNDNMPTTEPSETPNVSPAKRVIGAVLFLIVIAVVIFGVDAIMNIFRAFMGYK